MNVRGETETLIRLVSARIPVPTAVGTIHLSVQSVGRGDWVWFHAEHLLDGRHISQPANVPVKLESPPVDGLEALADQIAAAINAQFERQQQADE